MKYIMMKQYIGDVTRHVPIIFPNELVHQDVAKGIQRIPQMRMSEPVSAGFIQLGSTISCFGESETLGLPARDEDGEIIKTMDYTHGLIT